MNQLTSLSIDWFELLLILVLQGITVLLLLALPKVRRDARQFLDNNKVSVYTWAAVITFLLIIYRNNLTALFLQPPAYSFYLGLFLVLLSWILSTNQKNYEVTTMSTTKDIARVDEKVSETNQKLNETSQKVNETSQKVNETSEDLNNFINTQFPSRNQALKEELKEEMTTIVADTVKQTLAAIKADPSLLQ